MKTITLLACIAFPGTPLAAHAQTIVDLFNAILTGEEQESGATPLSIYDDNKHICSLIAKDGTQILELIIEREDGDRLLQIGEVEELK